MKFDLGTCDLSSEEDEKQEHFELGKHNWKKLDIHLRIYAQAAIVGQLKESIVVIGLMVSSDSFE